MAINKRVVLALYFCFASCMVSAAGIHKCTDASGSIVYTDQPYAASAKKAENVAKARELTEQEKIQAKIEYHKEQAHYHELKAKDIRAEARRKVDALIEQSAAREQERHEQDAPAAR